MGVGRGFSEKPEADEETRCLCGCISEPALRELHQRGWQVGVLKRTVPVMQIQACGAKTEAEKRTLRKSRVSGDTLLLQSRGPSPHQAAPALPPWPAWPLAAMPPHDPTLLSGVTLLLWLPGPWPSIIQSSEGEDFLGSFPTGFPAPSLDPGTRRCSVNIWCLNKIKGGGSAPCLSSRRGRCVWGALSAWAQHHGGAQSPAWPPKSGHRTPRDPRSSAELRVWGDAPYRSPKR